MSLTIDATYDPSVTALQTSDPTLYTNYTNSVNAAVAYFDSHISNNITINIDFGWGEVAGSAIASGASGESSSVSQAFTYAQVLAGLRATDTTSAVQTAAVASLPSSDPTNGATFNVNFAEQLALGGLPGGSATNTSLDGSVGLDATGTNWTWAGGTYTANSEDAVGTLEHEISEVLGRSDLGGASNNYTPLDLFRYTAANGSATDPIGAAAGARDEPFAANYNVNAPSYFSYDGSKVTLLYETPDDVAHGTDIADWAPSVGQDSFADGGDGAPTPVSTTDLQEMNVLGYDLACYVSGTKILTERGEVAVEKLQIGEMVVTAGGALRPIKWIGHRAIDCSRHPDPEIVWPVRVARSAFGDNMPTADLWLSPGHQIVAEGVLIPIKLLENGKSIAQHERSKVEYWHVELDRHDILLAQGMPAESYLDCGNRRAFVNGGEFIELHPDFAPKHWAETCLPLVLAGAEVQRAKAALLARVHANGNIISSENDLHLIADGRPVEPMALSASRFAFVLPEDAAKIVMRSHTFVPSHVNAASDDMRSLGICVARLQIDGTDISIDDDAAFNAGWHDCENQSWRWTRGDVQISAGTRLIVIDLAGIGFYWKTSEDNAAVVFDKRSLSPGRG